MTTKAAWDFCFEKLLEVSRSFALPISFLDEKTRNPVALSYLLCRMVDCIEDAPDLPHEQRDKLYAAFREFLVGEESGATFVAEASAFKELIPAEQELMAKAEMVKVAWDSLEPKVREICQPWIAEMSFGMQIFNHRMPHQGFRVLENRNDLERYCFYVAGTVGHLLTGLFSYAYGYDAQTQNELKANTESFALGLQLTNILKDIADDHERGFLFVPKTCWRRESLTTENLLSLENRSQAHAALVPIFEMADHALLGAFNYLLLLPKEDIAPRLFCGVPLLMAIATLAEAKNNDGQFEKDQVVKIPRALTASIVNYCQRYMSDDEKLRAAYQALKSKAPLPQ
jgi:farnesyl-diphosphate farnesyltransferase